MANMQKPIEKATVQELRDFATKHLGLECGNLTKAELAANIKTAWAQPYILVEDPETPNDHQQPARVVDPNADLKPGYVRMIIQIVDEPGGEEPVPVGVNGKVMLIPRGEKVDVPERYWEALRHAERFVYDAMRDGGINPVPRKVSAFPHQVLAVSPARETEAA